MPAKSKTAMHQSWSRSSIVLACVESLESRQLLSVGGTALDTDASGDHSSQTDSSQSAGEISGIEDQPSSQRDAETSDRHSTLNGSYDAAASTGFTIHNSESDAGTFDGGTEVFPASSATHNNADTEDDATGTDDFHDVTSGQRSARYGEHAGYDGVTGLSTPKAPQVMAAVAAAGSAGGQLATAVGSAPVPSIMGSSAVEEATPPTSPFSRSAITEAALLLIRQADAAANLALSAAQLPLRAAEMSDLAPAAVFQQMIHGVGAWQSGLPIASTAQPLSNAIYVSDSAAEPIARAAARTLETVGSAIMGVIGEAADASASRAMAVTVPYLSTLGTFADGIADFARESAALATVSVGSPAHVRAWRVTLADAGRGRRARGFLDRPSSAAAKHKPHRYIIGLLHPAELACSLPRPHLAPTDHIRQKMRAVRFVLRTSLRLGLQYRHEVLLRRI